MTRMDERRRHGTLNIEPIESSSIVRNQEVGKSAVRSRWSAVIVARVVSLLIVGGARRVGELRLR
jgi:hypothetical protein